mmetsp:Transcript_61772/g.133871  ORF Transcript_61772/g.133871 Transcript_61772/m.133871 type:complete len:278 (+) Transcript_61772:34-867(+)
MAVAPYPGSCVQGQRLAATAMAAVAVAATASLLRRRASAQAAVMHKGSDSISAPESGGSSPSAPAAKAPPKSDGVAEMSFDAQVIEERRLIRGALETVLLVRRTKAYAYLPHPYAVERELLRLERDLGEISDLLGGSAFFWRLGRDEPMERLLDLPLLRLAGSRAAIVPVSLGFVKETIELGEEAVARYLVSGTDPDMSRYREYSPGILDSLQRNRLLKALQVILWPCWDMPLTWGDEDDCVVFGGATAHNTSAFGVAQRSPWEAPGLMRFSTGIRT